MRAILCRSGYHDWSAWAPVPDDDCAEERHCRHCPLRETRENHDWSPWTVMRDRECTRERHCHRCGEPNVSVNHEWEASGQ